MFYECARWVWAPFKFLSGGGLSRATCSSSVPISSDPPLFCCQLLLPHFLNVELRYEQVALGALRALRAMHRDTKHIQRRETTFEACWIRGVRSGAGDGARVGPVEPTCVHYCVWWQVGAGTRVCASVAYSSVQPSTLPSVGPYSSLCSVEPSALLSAGCTRGSSHGRQCATQGTCQGSPWTTCQQLIGHHDNLHDTRSHVPSRTGVEKVSEGCGEGHKRLD
jgi:hypothetical protein